MADDDIAIVGAGCRFPGADNLDEFWKILLNGENHVTEIPKSRWKNDAFYNADPSEPGKTYVRKAGLLKHHDKWDNRLFGISDTEADRVDPQQRYILECVHMALEDGGLTRKEIYGSNTGVIIGCMNNDYKSICNSEMKEVNSFNATGTSASILSARVSYVYNLQGTCLTLDTACSSALVAVHLAIQAIKTGDCDMVICGGVSSILSPDTFVTLCKARMLSPTGQCQSFCETADGYARGEGCGVVILKLLKSAIEDGNKIWATIKTGSNQDGSVEKPMTAPSLEQQIKLLEEVYKTHQFNPEDIQYIEAHGTGTARGDPTEMNALGKFFSTHKSQKAAKLTIPVGSVKTNIGHTESAAGIAGLLKVLLMMENGKYVQSLHVDSDLSNVNKAINLSKYGFAILTKAVDWHPLSNGYRFACLNSFGFGGSNVHAIITQKGSVIKSRKTPTLHKNLPVCISGVSRESLHNNLEHFKRELGKTIDNLNDIAVTSFYFRDIYPYRTLVIGNSIEELQADTERKMASTKKILPKKDTNTVFVFCGVGTTWTGMGREMMEENEIFKTTIRQLDTFLFPLVGWRITDKLVNRTCYDDPLLNHIAIFCIQVGLIEVWRSFGIVPDKIIGQSVGEVAAAYAARYLSLEEAVEVIYHRSLILSRQKEGSMAVIGNLDIDIVECMCKKLKYNVNIAVYSSPVACTVSGESNAIYEIKDSINKRQETNIFFKDLPVKYAYHSQILESCTDEIEEAIDHIFSKELSETSNVLLGANNMVSTVSGGLVSAYEVRHGLYWAKNIRQPVLFMQAIKNSYEEMKNNIYLEIGPRPVLRAHISNIFKDSSDVHAIPSMLYENEVPRLHRTMTDLFELGKDIRDNRLDKSMTGKISSYPRYHFCRSGSIFIPKITKQYFAGFILSTNDSHLFTQKLSDKEFQILIDTVSTPFVYDHFLSNKIIVPGATYIEAAFHAGTTVLKDPANKLSVSTKFLKTFSPKTDRQSKIFLRIDSRQDGEMKFTILHAGKKLANGIVRKKSAHLTTVTDIERLRLVCSIHKSRSEFYDSLKKLDFVYGEALSFIRDAWISETKTECLTKIIVPEKYDKEIGKTHFHPAVLDSVFQIFGMFQDGEVPINKNSFLVPEGVEVISIYRRVDNKMYCYAKQVKVTDHCRFYNGFLMSTKGEMIASIENFKIRIVGSENKEQSDNIQAIKINWIEDSGLLDKPSRAYNKIIFVSDIHGSSLQKAFEKHVEVETLNTSNLQSFEMKDLDERTPIVYHAGGGTEILDLHDTNILTNATKRFLELKTILSTLNEIGTKNELTVITENTQMCPERNLVCCNGAELWGMFRCAIHEGIYRNMKIVDIDRDNFSVFHLIRAIFIHSKSQVEYAMSGCRIFQSKFGIFQNTNFHRREISADISQNLSLYARKSEAVEEPFIIQVKEKQYRTGHIRIRVDAFTLHEKWFYYNFLKSVEINNISTPVEKEEGQLLALEGVGKIEKTNDEIIFMHPVVAENIIDVPQQNIIRKADFPTYTNGTILLANVIVRLVAQIKDNSNVLLLGQSEDSQDFGLKMLTSLMKRKDCTFHHMKSNSFTNGKFHFEHIDTLVLTEFATLTHIQKIMHCLPHLRNFISLQFFVQNDVQSLVQCCFPHIEVIVLSSMELFNAYRIGTTMPVIRKYLSALSKNTIKIRNRFILDLPMKCLNFNKVLFKESFKCFSYESSLFRSTASYIIVGGLTGLGWEILCLMAEMGAGVIVTLSRSRPSLNVQNKIKQLEMKHFCKIMCLQADVADSKSVETAFKRAQTSFPNHQIKGIFHGAGVLNDSMLLKLSKENVDVVLSPKILGVLNLHRCSLNMSLDYFIVHSSIVSMIGNQGQCNYAAGNSFLDTFVQYRRNHGLPAQGINWGPLTVGMAAKSETDKSHLEKKGLKSMNREHIRRIFVEAVQSNSTNVVYADIIWEKLLALPSFVKQTSKYSEFNKLALSNQRKFRHIDPAEILKLDGEKRLIFVKEALREIMQDVLVTDLGVLEDDMSLIGLGIDSMAIMSLSNIIDEVFSCRIPFMMLNADETTLSVVADNIIQSLENGVNRGELHLEHAPDLKYEHLFVSNITFMQRDVLDNIFLNTDDPYFLRVLDIKMSGIKITMSDWEKIIRRVLKMNPELLKRFYFSDAGNVIVEEVSENHPSVKIKQITKKEFQTQQREDIRLSMSEEMSNILPVSFRIALSRNKSYLRIIHHAVAVDLKGLSLLCKAIAITVPDVLLENEKSDLIKPIDIPALIRKEILPKMDELNTFWDTYLAVDIKPITLGKTLQEVNAAFCSIFTVDVPKIQFLAIRNYATKLKITMYEFIMSLYQLFLYIGSGSKIVSIGSATDLRYHVPDLRHVITRCTNYIPVIANIDEGTSIEEFIQTNSAKIATTSQHGAFPSSLILSKLQNDEVKRNVFRHFLAMNDLTGIDALLNNNGYIKTTFGKMVLARPTRETFMYVRYDLQQSWMQFEIGYNSEICGQYGPMFSNILLLLADEAFYHGDKTIRAIRDDLMMNKLGVHNTVSTKESYSHSKIVDSNLAPEVTIKDPMKNILQINQYGNRESNPTKGPVIHETKVSTIEKDIQTSKVPILEKQVLLTGEFQKQTKHGWDHKVQVTLESDGKDTTIKWGKTRRIRKQYDKSLTISKIACITTRRINGIASLIIDSDKKTLVFKSSDGSQVQKWVETIESFMGNEKL